MRGAGLVGGMMAKPDLEAACIPRANHDTISTVFDVDASILNATEWLCRRFQVLTGRTNVWLAVQLTNLSIVVYFVWAAVSFWNTELWIRIFVGLFCGGVLYALTQTVLKVSIEEYEHNAYRRVAHGYRNPRRVRDAMLRLAFLTLSIVLGYPILFVYVYLHLHVALLSYLLVILTTALLYLLACDPLPPCAGKVWEWLRSLADSGLAAPQPAPADSRPSPLPRRR
jgi:hypothetical protein